MSVLENKDVCLRFQFISDQKLRETLKMHLEEKANASSNLFECIEREFEKVHYSFK